MSFQVFRDGRDAREDARAPSGDMAARRQVNGRDGHGGGGHLQT